jgi:hypothetical protein
MVLYSAPHSGIVMVCRDFTRGFAEQEDNLASPVRHEHLCSVALQSQQHTHPQQQLAGGTLVCYDQCVGCLQAPGAVDAVAATAPKSVSRRPLSQQGSLADLGLEVMQ